MSTYNTPVELLGIFTTPAPTEYIPGLRLSITSSGKIGLFWGKHQFFDAKPFLSDVATPISPPTCTESLTFVNRISLVGGLIGIVSNSKNGLMPTSGFIDRGSITSENFDDLRNSGFYILSGATGNNAPFDSGIMCVIGKGNWCVQLAVAVTFPFYACYRTRDSSGSWRNWSKFDSTSI